MTCRAFSIAPRLVLLALLTFGATGGRAQSSPAAPSVELERVSFPLTPLRSVTGHGPPVVEVVLNHKIRATFLVDTGTTNTVITEAAVTQLGLTPKYMRDPTGAIRRFNGRPMQSAYLSSMLVNSQDKGTLGVLDFGGDVQVLPGSSVFPSMLGRVDGILGMNVLSGCTLFLDSASGWITLWSPRSLTARERMEIGMGDAVEVPLVQAEHNILQARTRFNDSEDVLLAIDTGAELTSIPAQVAERLHLIPDGPGRDVGTVYGRGHVMSSIARRMTFGGVVREEQRVNCVERATLANQSLGMDVLGQYRVLIDPAAKKMYLKPIASRLPPTLGTPRKATAQ